MIQKILFVFSLVLAFGFSTATGEKPQLREIDRIRLAEAFRIGDLLGEKLWVRWSKTPFSVLLVCDEAEFLIRHPKPSSDFTKLAFDSMLNSDLYFRKRTLNKDLQATFPVAGMIPTIVIGKAENTAAKTSTFWVLTVLHERFHQLQMSLPNYFENVEALNLSKGDQTGMWMLTYPFPYSDLSVAKAFSQLGLQLNEMLDGNFQDDRLSQYLQDKSKLQRALSTDDYKYFAFQVWQEGVARYTEYSMAKLAAQEYKPTAAFLALQDFSSFESAAMQILTDRIRKKLTKLDLKNEERLAFYTFGAAEALVLDRVKPGWRNDYFQSSFSLDPLFPKN